MRVLVTGASGFIGDLLVPELLKMNHDVAVVERYVAGRYGRLDRGREVTTHFVNLTDLVGIQETIQEAHPDVIFHLGALTPVSFSYSHPFETIETNYTATVNLAEAARKHAPYLSHFILSGTTEEYGNSPDRPATEEARCWPNSPYAAAKLGATNYLQYMNHTYNFPVTIMRATNTYGRTNDTHFFIERLIAQMFKGKQVKLGDPNAIRDFMYVDDHVNAYMSVFKNRDKAIGQIFNFSTGRSMTIKEAADITAKIFGYDGEILWNQVPKRPNDIFDHRIDSSKIRSILGWTHKYGFEDGIKLLIERMSAKSEYGGN